MNQTTLFLPLAIAVLIWMTKIAPGGVIRVAQNADPTNTENGNSWEQSTNLQRALSLSSSGDQIWVISGVYYPDEGHGQTDGDREAYFEFSGGVEMYGGFNGTETSLADRDVESSDPSFLSGDIDQDDANEDGNNITESTVEIVGENSFRVVVGYNISGPVVFDGFTVTAAQADNAGFGGGMRLNALFSEIRNCTFSGNYARRGGGMWLSSIRTPISTGPREA